MKWNSMPLCTVEWFNGHRHVYCTSMVSSACCYNFPCCFSCLSVTNLVTLQKLNLCWSLLMK